MRRNTSNISFSMLHNAYPTNVLKHLQFNHMTQTRLTQRPHTSASHYQHIEHRTNLLKLNDILLLLVSNRIIHERKCLKIIYVLISIYFYMFPRSVKTQTILFFLSPRMLFCHSENGCVQSLSASVIRAGSKIPFQHTHNLFAVTSIIYYFKISTSSLHTNCGTK